MDVLCSTIQKIISLLCSPFLLSSAPGLPQGSDKDGLDRKLLFWDRKDLSQLFPLIASLSLLNEVPLLSQQLINSLLHWPVQQATHLQRESLKQLCHHLAGQTYSEFERSAI